MQFNNSQLKAVKHKSGPMLVIAGPGSGKTTVLTARIRNLIEEYSVNPANILVITFTKAAASLGILPARVSSSLPLAEI